MGEGFADVGFRWVGWVWGFGDDAGYVLGVSGGAELHGGFVGFVEFEEGVDFFCGFAADSNDQKTCGEWVESTGVADGADFGDTTEFGHDVE